MNVFMISGDPHLLVPGTEANRRLQLQKDAVDVLDVVVWPQVHGTWTTLMAARHKRYDVVTVQDPFWRGLLGVVVARASGAKLNVQVHTDIERELTGGSVRRILARFVLAHADSVRVVSERVVPWVKACTKAPVAVLPVYVDLEKIRSAPALDLTTEYPELRGKKIILVGARLEPEKQVARAIALMPDVLRSVPDAVLLIAGTGSQEVSLHALVRHLHLESHVIVAGYRPDVAGLYKSASLVLVTSAFESYGASIVEALAAGVPVVSRDVGIAREAGAIVVPDHDLLDMVVHVLTTKTAGELRLPVMSASQWQDAWRHTL